MKALHYYARRFFAPIMISCEEEGMMNSGQELVRLPFDFPKSIHLCVVNESMQDETITVKWQIRDTAAKVIRAEETTIEVSALTSVWLDKVDLPDIDIYNEYVSFQAIKDGKVVSEGTVIFSYPKYFRYKNPQLSASVEGNPITVFADKYAKNVEILNDNEDLILTDNYFDMNGGSKTVEVICGNIDHLRLRSVYDI